MHDDFGSRYREFEALATHRLDQDGEMQLAAARDAELVGVLGLIDAQRDVVLQFLHESLADLPTRQEFAVLSGKRGLVDRKGHADGRLVNRERRQCFFVIRVAQGIRDVQFLDTAEYHDIAG